MPAEPERIIREFTVSEVIERALKGPFTIPNGSRHSLTNSSDFSGVSVPAACELLANGWPKGLADMVRAVESVPVPMGKGEATRLDVAGWYPDIPRAIAGDPLNMLSTVRKLTHQHAEIYVSAAMVCRATTEEIFARGAAIVRAIDDLEHSGVRCRVVATYAGGAGSYSLLRGPQGPRDYQRDGGAHLIAHRVLVKDHRDPLDLDRMAFMFGHRSMFRRIIFSTYETEPLEVCQRFGFGKFGGYTHQGEAVQDFMVPDDAVYIPQNMPTGQIRDLIIGAFGRTKGRA